jgi:trimethylamine--corrinoid protein Co-methyltransferase
MIRQTLRPKLKIINDDFVESIIEEAFRVLDEVGIFVENADAYVLLADHGARPAEKYDKDKKIGKLTFPGTMIEEAIASAPKVIKLWDISGENPVDLEGDAVHFDPGSAALYLYDRKAGKIRKPVTDDLRQFIHLVDKLPNYHMQSTALVSSDVPEACGDSYRLYWALKHGCKPVITGLFEKASFDIMKEMLIAVRGGKDQLKDKPLAIFDACPSPPLMWSDLTAHSVIEAARLGIPSEYVSMPLTGSTAPMTLSGAVTQHAAETLCGVVLAQTTKPGAPVIWGGSPSAMDMRYGTTPMGAIETMMIDMADVAVGKALGLPTHAYMGLSDTKRVDYQGGLESGMGILLAALSGINVVSGPGMMDFESCQSFEKLVLDNEICGMAYRLIEGMAQRDEVMALDLLAALEPGGHLLTHEHTLKWFRDEVYAPGKSIDRRARGSEDFKELDTAEDRAAAEVEKILSQEHIPAAEEKLQQELDKMMEAELKKAGMEGIPK